MRQRQRQQGKEQPATAKNALSAQPNTEDNYGRKLDQRDCGRPALLRDQQGGKDQQKAPGSVSR